MAYIIWKFFYNITMPTMPIHMKYVLIYDQSFVLGFQIIL